MKGGWRTLAAGGMAGAIDCCFTMPMDTMSTQMQLQGYRSPVACTRAILLAKGVPGLYAGFWPFMVQSAAKSSVRFFSFELLSQAVDRSGVDRSRVSFWPGSRALCRLLSCAICAKHELSPSPHPRFRRIRDFGRSLAD
jgi:hypothetical protein